MSSAREPTGPKLSVQRRRMLELYRALIPWPAFNQSMEREPIIKFKVRARSKK